MSNQPKEITIKFSPLSRREVFVDRLMIIIIAALFAMALFFALAYYTENLYEWVDEGAEWIDVEPLPPMAPQAVTPAASGTIIRGTWI